MNKIGLMKLRLCRGGIQSEKTSPGGVLKANLEGESGWEDSDDRQRF